MDQEKLIKLQIQMQQNNADYKDFLDDIESWSQEVKEKEKKLTSDDKLTSSDNLYPIRNAVVRTKKEKKPKINAYDYRGWDKYDVDKELEDDSEICQETNSKELLNIADLVKEHREVGNIRFKEGKYKEAMEEYTRAIQYDSNNSVLYTNRAASLLKVGKYEDAENDCTKAVTIDNKSFKAFYRRAKCRLLLSKKEEALEDLQEVLKLDPTNKVAKKELWELEKNLNIKGVVEPIFGAPLKGKESSKPLFRVNIVDVDPNKHLSEVIKVSTDCTPSKPLIAKDTVTEQPPVFILPLTAVQLSKDLTKFRRNPMHRAKYILNIPMNSYKKLIGQSLDCQLLQDFIDGLSFSLTNGLISPEGFVTSVNCIADVARFASLWLMMSSEEKRQFEAAVHTLDSHLASALRVSV